MSDRFVGGKEFVKHKGTVKTIEGKNGDVIDCVDIYQQPAFDHPLLKNHTIQMEPHSRSIPNVTNGEFSDAELFQDLHENEHCPEGTIPIIRHAREDEYYPHGAISAVARNQKKLNIRVDLDAKGHEYAGVGLSGGKYYGARAFLNVWKPATLGNGDLSFAQVGVQAGPPDRLNYIQAGWMVNSRDNEPRVFLYWTSDGNKKTGCYNLNCPGFVQVTNKIGLGAALKPPSTYKGTQFSIPIAVYQFRGNWWLQVNEIMLGYLPSHIFTDLRTSATAVSWGGQVFDAGKMGHHTSTQMGSGHFASEGFGKASYFTHVEYKHETGYFLAAEGLRQYVTKPTCYSLNLIPKKSPDFGIYFYYGGPGFSATCP